MFIFAGCFVDHCEVRGFDAPPPDDALDAGVDSVDA
jgi:hypothetical protein